MERIENSAIKRLEGKLPLHRSAWIAAQSRI
jgi:hypothetical protein